MTISGMGDGVGSLPTLPGGRGRTGWVDLKVSNLQANAKLTQKGHH